MAWGISLNHTLMYGTRIVRITYSSFCSMSKDGVNMVSLQSASYIQRYRAVHGHVAIFARRACTCLCFGFERVNEVIDYANFKPTWLF